MLPFGQGLEIGVSGAIGPQDNQPDLSVMQWHYGLDWKLTNLYGFDVSAEYVQGMQQGWTDSMTACDVAPCLKYKGAYVLVDRRVCRGSSRTSDSIGATRCIPRAPSSSTSLTPRASPSVDTSR